MPILSDVVYTARKNHRCCQCGTNIKPKEKYRRQVYKDGDICTYSAHLDCDEAGLEYNHMIDSGYNDEMYNLIDCMNDVDDREWLVEKIPTVAKRLGIRSTLRRK